MLKATLPFKLRLIGFTLLITIIASTGAPFVLRTPIFILTSCSCHGLGWGRSGAGTGHDRLAL